MELEALVVLRDIASVHVEPGKLALRFCEMLFASAADDHFVLSLQQPLRQLESDSGRSPGYQNGVTSELRSIAR